MGEIGIARREFLYDITVWEARRIIRGYRKRNRLEQQLMRLNAYTSFFAMRENKMRLKPESWLPLPWEKENAEDDEPISDEERDRLIELMNEMNKEGSAEK